MGGRAAFGQNSTWLEYYDHVHVGGRGGALRALAMASEVKWVMESIFVAAVVNYDSLRMAAKTSFAERVSWARSYVGKLQTAHRAAEKALDMFAFFADVAMWTCLRRGVLQNKVPQALRACMRGL